ncbi:MAB_1171c family putative transporter, partial [Micromonospora zhanjiangensis]
METALYAICAAAGWLAFGYKLRDLRSDRDNRVLRAMVYAFGSFAAGVTLAILPLAAAVDTSTGLPNLAKVLAHAGVMSVAAQAEVLLLFLALPGERAAPRARLRLLMSAGAYAALVGLWLVTLAAGAPVALTVEYARVPAVLAYLVVYLCVFVAYSADIARLCWRFARVAARPWLRRGLRVTAMGAVFGLAYCASKAGYLVGYRLGAHPAGEQRVAAVLVTISALLMIVGLTLPAWGPAVDLALTWSRRQVAWRRLGPLWTAVTAAQPQLVLDDGVRRTGVAFRDIDYALHRRITEIRDGRLALRPYIDERVTEAAAELLAGSGLPAAERAAVLEATMIAAGVRGLRTGTVAERPDRSDPY